MGRKFRKRGKRSKKSRRLTAIGAHTPQALSALESATKADANNDQRIRALFSVVTFTIGFGLLVLRQVTLSGIESARNWIPNPCVIEQSEFVIDDDTGERILNMVFSYEYDGQRYTSDRIDMLPGRMGDDGDWEAALKERQPVGSKSICHVDPANPERAVLDREHGASGAGNMLLLAFPFLAIGAALGFSCWRDWTQTHAAADPTEVTLSPPPRQVSVVTAMTFLLSLPSSIQVAWAFLVGFTFWFSIMDGPESIADMSAGNGQIAEAVIVSVSPIDQYTFGEQVYEYKMRYQVGNRKYSIASYELGRSHAVDDSVEVVHYPARPDASHLKGARRRSTPSWVVWIPLGVMLVLAMGIVANYWFNLRSIPLLRIGQLVAANRESQHAAPSFQVNGDTYFVNQRAPSGTNDQDTIVLYDPRRPSRHIGLSSTQQAAISGHATWSAAAKDLIVPAMCLAAVIWLCGWASAGDTIDFAVGLPISGRIELAATFLSNSTNGLKEQSTSDFSIFWNSSTIDG